MPDRVPGHLLEFQVDRRVDLQPATEDPPGPVTVDELLLDVVGEVLRGALVARETDRLRTRHRPSRRVAVDGSADVALVEHLLQHQVPAGPGAFLIGRWVERGRVLGDAREQRRLPKRQLARAGAVVEVRLRRLLDAVGPVAEVDRVQVGGQDPVLRPALLELPRERRLPQLARDRPLVVRVRVLDELLRDRRPALHGSAAAHVRPERAHDPAYVDAAVLVEALVLDRDDRLLHQRRDLVGAEQDPALRAAEDGEHAAVVRVDEAVRLVVDPARVERRDLAGDRGHETDAEGGQAQHRQEGQQCEEAKLPDPAAALGPRHGGTSSAQQNCAIVTALKS